MKQQSLDILILTSNPIGEAQEAATYRTIYDYANRFAVIPKIEHFIGDNPIYKGFKPHHITTITNGDTVIEFFEGKVYASLSYDDQIEVRTLADLARFELELNPTKLQLENFSPQPTIPQLKEYSKEEYPTLEHLEDTICENAGVYDDSDDWDGYEETFTYDGKTYKVLIEHDGTYMEYGIKGSEVTFTEIKK